MQHAKALKRLTQGLPESVLNNHLLGTNPTSIPTGLNNHYINNVSFMFTMTDYKVGYLKMTDDELYRYSVPTEAVGGPQTNPTMRLEMLGF